MVRVGDVDDEWCRERERCSTAHADSLWWTTSREERAMRTVCVEGADKEGKTDRETDGDDQCAAGRAEAKYPWRHDLHGVVVQDLLVW